MTSTSDAKRPRVLVLSRSYPNNVTELLGLWVKQLVSHSKEYCDACVISPVPYCPPGMPETFARFRAIDKRSRQDGIDVYYPRFFTGPGYSLYRHEWLSYYIGVRRLTDRLRHSFPFDLIHAHFTYPDGVAAVRLGHRYNVPVVITEHVPWEVWDQMPQVRNRAAQAVRVSRFHISVSESVRRSVEHSVGPLPNLRVIPNGVDGSLFTLPPVQMRPKPGQIIFAGAVRPVKGVDVLLKAVRVMADRGREASLIIVGEAFYGQYRKEEERLRAMVTDLGLESRVSFPGKKLPSELRSYMQESAVLVLPSRMESFGMVLVEALACGTPVVATRCGGPEDIVDESVGLLVPVEDPAALANAIEHILDHRADYDPVRLRSHAIGNFGLPSIGRKMEDIYRQCLNQAPVAELREITAVPGGSVAN